MVIVTMVRVILCYRNRFIQIFISHHFFSPMLSEVAAARALAPRYDLLKPILKNLILPY